MLRDAWYGAGWSHELGRNKPLARKLLGEAVVMFRDQDGTAHAISARCAHRNADMSSGKIVDNCLRCPFHGWLFDTGGRCVHIPALPPEAKISPKAVVRRYELREQQGILWIWLGDRIEIQPDPPHYEPLEPAKDRVRTHGRVRYWNGAFMHAIENALDVAHLPIAHRKVVGPGRPLVVPNARIKRRPDDRGFTVEYQADEEWRRKHGPWPMTLPWYGRIVGMTKVVEETLGVDFGGTFYQKDIYDTGRWDFLFANVTPADDEHTWFLAMTVRTRGRHFIGEWAQRWVIESINDGDQVIVESMFRDDPSATLREVSTPADAPSLAFRHMHSRLMKKEGRLPIMTRSSEARPGPREAVPDLTRAKEG